MPDREPVGSPQDVKQWISSTYPAELVDNTPASSTSVMTTAQFPFYVIAEK
jgi:hypothetical protein